jgi:hypothetical protein
MSPRSLTGLAALSSSGRVSYVSLISNRTRIQLRGRSGTGGISVRWFGNVFFAAGSGRLPSRRSKTVGARRIRVYRELCGTTIVAAVIVDAVIQRRGGA